MIKTPAQSGLLSQLVINTHKLIRAGYYKEPNHILLKKPSISKVLESKFTILAELKIKSPTSAKFFDPNEVELRLAQMAKHADAISVLTEPNYFLGSMKYLAKAIKQTKPILMKDIIISEQQILAGRNSSAILIIAKVLSPDRISSLIEYARNLGLEVILEVDNESDFQKFIDYEAQIIAINNRNLSTFQVDLENANHIMRELTPNKPVLGFSGYSSTQEIIKAKEVGLSGVLIGTKLSQIPNPDKFLLELKNQVGGVHV